MLGKLPTMLGIYGLLTKSGDQDCWILAKFSFLRLSGPTAYGWSMNEQRLPIVAE